MAVRDPRDDYPPRMGRNGGRVGRRAYPAHDSTLVTASTHFFDRVPLGDSAIDFFDPRAVSPNELPANNVRPNQTAVEVGPVDQRRGVAGDVRSKPHGEPSPVNTRLTKSIASTVTSPSPSTPTTPR
jgi:hypothetical protein